MEKTIRTVNPATGEVLKEYEIMPKEKIMEIAKNCNNAFHGWKNLSVKERGRCLKKVSEILRNNKQEYAELMTKEMGKPITESSGEIEKCASLIDLMIEKAEEWLKDEILEADGKKHLITYEPLGTVFIVMPWNFPFWQVFKVAIPPLFAGNTIILKHASNVTGCSLAIEELFKKAEVPENVLRSVLLDHGTTPALIGSSYVQACSLTGSVRAGSKIGGESGKNIKKIVLELGGSDPFIVLEDADIEKSAKAAVRGRFANAGQICTSSKRFIVHKDLAQEFTKKFSELALELKIGDPLDPDTKIGPLVDEKAVEDMESFVKDAVAKGAEILTGGKRAEKKGCYFEPTVLANANEQMSSVCQEVFGPVAPIIIADSEEDAIRIANNSEFGLSASVWTKDLEKGEKLARKIETGGVFVNSTSTSHGLRPLGGIKKSGFGRELSSHGIKEFTNLKSINIYD